MNLGIIGGMVDATKDIFVVVRNTKLTNKKEDVIPGNPQYMWSFGSVIEISLD